ncbi:MAG: RNA polymerase subunit sigma-70 [Planctomycetota bacterium]|nr:MAG: RNA polymerase subunit sigma-70 [Planctomycetota bacterium]
MVRSNQVTLLLNRMSAGQQGASDELFPIVYDELRRLAAGLMRGERSGHTLQATALVHEVWLKLVDIDDTQWEGRGHFMRVASRAMRNLLVDHARARRTDKRGGKQARQPLDELVAVYEDRGIDLLALSTALDDLGQMDEQLARLVDLRFFGGLENRETAQVLGISLRSTERAWFSARAFLRTQLGVAM